LITGLLILGYALYKKYPFPTSFRTIYPINLVGIQMLAGGIFLQILPILYAGLS